jgi:hypothetical protein
METATQELIIVKAVATLPLPATKDMGKRIGTLIEDMKDQEESVKTGVDKLDSARQAKKDGNVFGNWWYNRADAIKEAQIDLSSAVGKLAASSSELLLINMAISKVLHGQHVVLLEQQIELERQAEHIRGQNERILEQQTIQERQQEEIIAANRGIMEAKGITNDQARKLVDCVVRIEGAEKVMREANLELRERVDDALASSQAQYAAGMALVEAEWKGAHEALATRLQTLHDDATVALHDLHATSSLAFTRRSDDLETAITTGLARERLERIGSEAALQGQMNQAVQAMQGMRRAFWAVGAGLVASLAWQAYAVVWLH